ncbi:MAG: fibronectin type III domain-containing protein, partial [Chlorobi bacterium]|nr:fibronectin type III domain-containing protein [Chlorobiota bacterium]
MKRVSCFVGLLLVAAMLPAVLRAQSITNYTFSYSTGTFTSIAGQTGTQTATLFSGTTDDGYYNLVPIGFDFLYMGQLYNQVSASTNGWMTLGQYASTALSNNLTSGTPRPVIAPLWDDLQMANGAVYYRTDGNAPNRVFTIEWNNVRWYYSQTTPTISFQVKLYEGTGVVQFIYNQESGSLGGSESASIGITGSGTGSGNFLSVNTTFDAVSSTTETTTINSRPPSGYTMTFTPPTTTPSAPTNLTFTNVLPGQMTLNWQDNSNNEVGFLIVRSTDGSNYSFVTLTAANATSYTVTGLTPSTTYYWRIYAVTEGRASTPLSGTQATSGPLLSGTRQIPTTNYPNIKTAIDSIYALGLAGPVVFEFLSSYTSTSEPAFPLVFNGAIPGASSTNTVTFRPASGVSNVVVAASVSTVLLDFNGASWIVFDGRPGGTGTSQQLTIANMNTTASIGTIRLYNGATNNTFRYCRILGASSSTTSGVVNFGAPGTSVGNRKNTLTNCNIGDTLSTNQPYCAVYASGNTTVLSDSNTISNCNIYNYFIASTTNYGIYGSTGYTRWIITGNSFYQTTSRTFTSSVTLYHVFLSGSTNSGGHYIANNVIGGTQPGGGGSQMTYNISTTTLTPILYGIYCSLVTSTLDTTRIIGNTITNLYFRTASTSTTAANGIFASGGNLLIQNNTIGSATATNSITLQSTTTSTPPTFNAIYGFSSSTQGFSTTISGNTVGGITMNAENTASGWIFIGINLASTVGAESYVTNNVIGSTTTANSINAATSATGTQQLTGISISAGSSYVRTIVSGNTVANLNNNGTSSTSGAQFIRGILINSGIVTVENNTVRNLTTTTLNSSTSFPSMALTGIAVNSTTQPLGGLSGHIVRGNVVHSLLSTNTSTVTASHWVLGMGVNSSTSAGVVLVERNSIHSLALSATPSSTSVAVIGTGMLIFGGQTNIRNNMIRLGLDPNGNAVTGQVSFYGLYKNNSQPTGIYHNSIYIGGSVASGAGTVLYSIGLFRAATSTDEIRNNIVQVNRTTSSGTGYHVGVVIGATTTLAMDNNLYYVPGTGGFVGGIGTSTVTLYQTLAAWRSGSGMDASTGYGDANFVNPNGSATTGDLHISTTGSTPVESNGAPIVYSPAVTEDFDGQSRSSLTPIDIGADAGNFTTNDIVPPVIQFTPLGNGTASSTRTVPNIVIIDGGSGVNTATGTRPRLYYKKSTEANQYVGNTSTDNGWKWVEASNTSSPFTFVINYSLLTSALSTGDVIQYFFVAQDLAATPNVAVGGATLTTAPTSVALTNANFPATPFYSYTIAGSVSGTIQVGPSQSFTSLTNTGGVFEYINSRVVTGNITILVTGDLTNETGAVALNAMQEEGTGAGTYTITIRPATGVTATISGTNTSGGLLRFNSAQRVIIDGRRPGDQTGSNLTIVNNATSGSIAAIQFMGPTAFSIVPGCQRDTVRFCTIKTGLNTNTGAYGIFVGGSTVGSSGYGNSYIVLSDNVITGTYYGIRIIGLTGFPNDTITIARNTIGGSGSSYGSSDSIKYRAIMASWSNNLIIERNAILNVSPASSSGAGIQLDNASGSLIRNNTIDGILGYTTSSTNVTAIACSTAVANAIISGNRINRVHYTASGNWWAYGIDVNSVSPNANILIANNMVSNVAHDYGISTTWSTYGIRITSTGNVRVYHNSVFLRGSYFVPSSGAGQSAALLVNTSTANIDVRNNVFANRMYGASGSKSYALYVATTPSTIPLSALDYNNYDVSG